MTSKEFIEVTSIHDGRKACIRAACITSVVDNGETQEDFGTKPEHRRINFDGQYFDAVESYDDINDMIYNAEL